MTFRQYKKDLRATVTPITLSVALALAAPALAWAQAAAPAAADGAATADDALGLEAIVVTGTSEKVSKMNSSVSISTLDADQLVDVQPTSVADVLRSIPGVHSESSGGASNANVTVRGIPISAGGSRYVMFEEDGLPILQIGDLDFLTPDSYLRTDSMTDRLEVVRGGSASTLTTNGPGGIINFLSKTGGTEEQTIGITEGLNFNEARYDFGKGGSVGAKTDYYLGGFYREGKGLRDTPVQVENGGQIRLNVTQHLDNGYVRLSIKELDDRTPTALPVPMNNQNGNLSPVAGIDPRTASLYSPYLLPDGALATNNTTAYSNMDQGFIAHSSAIGAEAGLDLGSGWSLEERFRYAQNSGHFLGIYAPGGVAAAPGGTTFLTGPNAGKAYAGEAFTAVTFNVDIQDASLTANDLKVVRRFDLGGGNEIGAIAGLYSSSQRVQMLWNFNQYLLQAANGSQAVLSSASNGTPAFGGCCQRYIDATYDTRSPYLNLTASLGAFNVDASVRHDQQTATGLYAAPYEATLGGAFAYNLGSLSTPATAYGYGATSPGGATPSGSIDYTVGHTSYSLGGNWRLAKALSLFARYSDGVSFNGDRIAWGQGAAGTTGGNPNEVKQLEGGVKYHAGGASVFATLFQARTSESNYDVTTQVSTANTYLANGVEFEGGYVLGDLRLNAGITYTDSKITSAASAALVDTTPGRLAKFLYQGGATYESGPLRGGLYLTGQTEAHDNNGSVTLPGYTIVNAALRYQVVKSTAVNLGASNLFNKLALTESEGSNGRALDGRAVKLGISYSFY